MRIRNQSSSWLFTHSVIQSVI